VSGLLAFPDPVNEKAARVVAGGVLVIALAALATGAEWLAAVLAVGFLLRVLSGPRFSPLGLLATKVVAPRLGDPKYVPGPPKRFAQGIGLAVTTAAAILAIGLDDDTAAAVLLAVLVVAAGLESLAGFCLGCRAFALLMRAGLVPQSVCERCAT
jgi:Domain of unknown function (DUF4395)